MKVGIYTNQNRDEDGVVTALLTEKLKQQGFDFVLLDNNPVFVYSLHKINPREEVSGCDFVFAIGGDGTMLEVAKQCAVAGVPVLGINKGKLGFLSEISENEIDDALYALKMGKYNIENRFLMKITNTSGVYYAINEAFLGRRQHNLATVNIYVDGVFTDKIKGDGVIVSTPTGSTAYSLSCGGPVISPELNAMLIVGVCPHSLHTRPIVVSGDSSVIVNPETYNIENRLIIDGKEVEDYDRTSLTVTMSEISVKFVRIKTENFYGRLLDKMRYWSEGFEE